MSAILEWLRANGPALFEFINRHKTWLGICLATINTLVLFDILYFRAFFGGVQKDWPDAIICYGKVGSQDGVNTRTLYYLTHLDHQLSGGPVVSYRAIGSAPHTLHFDQHTNKFKTTQAMEGLDADCIGKDRDWLITNRRGLYFLSNRPFEIGK